MADHPEIAADLCRFAPVLVRKVVQQGQLAWIEPPPGGHDPGFVPSWQVWREEGEAGLAENRLASRQPNLLRDDASERKHEPQTKPTRSNHSEDQTPGTLGDENVVRDRHGGPVANQSRCQ